MGTGGNLFDELKRRNVFRVGIAYLVVGWLLVQITALAVPAFAMPPWVNTVVFYFALLGFPFALVFAWAFELTPEGLRRSHRVDRETSITPTTGRKLDFVIIGALALGLGYFAWDKFAPVPSDEAEEGVAHASIAVLPFVNMSSDPEQLYFSDGISEEILNVLAQIPDLHVTSRSSAFQFRGNDIHIPTVAETLGVAHVLEGSVRKSGLRVRITAQLIDAKADKHLWSETYDRELTDIFALQDEISAAIVDALRGRLGLQVEAAPRSRSAANTEAHEAYLRGRHLVEQRTRTTVEGAVKEFRKAVELDPNYALAHAELAIAIELSTRGTYGELTATEAHTLATPHAERAMALDPTLAEAHAAMGQIMWEAETLDKALAHFRQAVRINPNYSIVYTWMANITGNSLGRYDEMLALRETALRLDPLSIPAIGNYAGELMDRGRLDEADRQMAKLATIAPSVHASIRGMRTSLGGQWANAVLGDLDAILIEPADVWSLNALIWEFAVIGLGDEALSVRDVPAPRTLSILGRNEKALEAARTLTAESPDQLWVQAFLGQALAAVGDYAAARPLLEKAWQQYDERITIWSFGTNQAAALVAARRAATGNEAKNEGSKDIDIDDLLAALRDNARRLREAGMTAPQLQAGLSADYQEGIAAYLSGERDRGLSLIAKAADEGHFILPNEAYLQELYDDPGFAPIRAAQEARQARERGKVLAVVCNDNPYAAVWQPAEGTCDGVAASNGN